MSTDDTADYQRAKGWLKVLTGQVLRLRQDEQIWEEVQEIIKANPALHKPSAFYEWMKDMYVSGMAMAIRRQTDDDSRSISFMRLLKLIKGNPSLVSRKRYRNLFPADDEFVKQSDELGSKKSINDDYDGLVGAGKLQPTRDDIQAEIDELLRVTHKVVTLGDKVIAHHDQQKPTNLPTFAEVGEAIACLETLVQKYKLLFEATSISMNVTYQYDWKAILRVPWIP
jgi:AbiU2